MRETLSRLLEMLADGHELTAAEFGAFSDLDKSAVAVVREKWVDLDVATRALLLERAGEMADVHLDMNFEALGKVGFVEMLLFIGTLLLGFFYIIKKGGLKWE